MPSLPHFWHISWEYPPHTTGGLGVACGALVAALSEKANVRVWHPALFSEQGTVSSYQSYVGLACERGDDWDSLLERLLAGESLFADSSLGEVLRFSSHVLKEEPPLGTIVHAHDWHSVFAAVALKRRYGTPFVLHLHSTQLERCGLQARDTLYALEQWGMTEAERVICVSRLSAEFVSTYYAIDLSKISVVHNATLRGAVSARRSRSVSTLLFTGRMCSQKAPEMMIEIARRICGLYPHVQLVMAGEGEDLSAIRSVVEFCGLTDRVELLGKLPHEAMQGLYQRADVLCLPSMAEPFGIVAVEAASHGLAVVLSDRCGAAEVLTSAITVEANNLDAWVAALGDLIEWGENYAGVVQSVQKEAASRTWRDAADEILAVYASLGN